MPALHKILFCTMGALLFRATSGSSGRLDVQQTRKPQPVTPASQDQLSSVAEMTLDALGWQRTLLWVHLPRKWKPSGTFGDERSDICCNNLKLEPGNHIQNRRCSFLQAHSDLHTLLSASTHSPVTSDTFNRPQMSGQSWKEEPSRRT